MASPTDPAPHEETLWSERGFDGKLLHVRVDHVRLPSGRESVREVVEHPGAVGIVALTAADEVVLVRQWRHAVGRALLEIPAGTREPGEAVELTARRELMEETGYRAGETQEIATYYASAGWATEQLTLFFAPDSHAESFEAAQDEHTDVVLIPRAALREVIASGEIEDAKSLIGLLWLLSQPA
jgi:ADP-ribose pyrophosphatase